MEKEKKQPITYKIVIVPQSEGRFFYIFFSFGILFFFSFRNRLISKRQWHDNYNECDTR